MNDLAAVAVVATETGANITAAGTPLTAGDNSKIMVYVASDYGTLSAGTTVNVKLHSAGGMDYIKLIRLP